MSESNSGQRMKRRIRLENQMQWMQSHNSKVYPIHKQRVDDGRKLQSLLTGLKKADNPREEMNANILFASDNPRESVSKRIRYI